MGKIIKLCIIVLLITSVIVAIYGSDADDCNFFGLVNSSLRILPRPSFILMNLDPLYKPAHRVTKWTIADRSSIKAFHGWSENDFESADGYELSCRKRIQNEDPNSRIYLVDFKESSSNSKGLKLCLEIHSIQGIAFKMRHTEPVSIETDIADSSQVCSVDYFIGAPAWFLFVYFPADFNEWTRAKRNIPYISCSLNGGFAIKHWTLHSPSGQETCSSPEEASLRIEDECEKGGGMRFSSSKTMDCKSPLHGKIYRGDALSCLAEWQEGNHTYTIAYDDIPGIAMCIRMPQVDDRTGDLQVQFFFDGICQESSLPSYASSRNYLEMSLYLQDIPDPCHNISPWCAQLSMDSEINRNLCPKSSYVCRGASFWEPQRTPKDMRGDWFRETQFLGEGRVQITDKTIDFQHLGLWRFAGPNFCHESTEEYDEYILVSLPRNGCRPRAAFLRITPYSPSVVGFQLSHSSVIEPAMNRSTGIWPLTAHSICSYEGMYYGEIKDNLRDKFHIGEYSWYNLVKENSEKYVKCNVTKLLRVRLRLGKETLCQMKTEQIENTGFDIVLDGCVNATEDVKSGQRFHVDCLADFRGGYGWNTYIITRSVQPRLFQRTLVCWLFSDHDPLAYIMRVADCHDETLNDIKSGNKHPLATISLLTVTGATSAATALASTFVLLAVFSSCLVHK